MTKAMAVQLSGAYKRGQAVRRFFKGYARDLTATVKLGAETIGGGVKSGAIAVKDFARGVANK